MNKNEREKLVLDNINLVYYVLKKLGLYGLENMEKYYDLGVIGLVSGANNYDPTLDIKPSTYLIKCIKNSILQEKRNECRVFKFNLDNAISFEKKLSENFKVEDTIVSDINLEEDLLKKERYIELYAAIDLLSDMEKFIIIHTFGLLDFEIFNQQQLAKYFNVSQSYISRIKKRIYIKLKNILEKDKLYEKGKSSKVC